MSPEQGRGPERPEGQDFVAPGSEEVKAELDAREKGRLERIAALEDQLDSVDASIVDIESSGESEGSEILLGLYDQKDNLERQLRELEGE